MRLNRGQDVMSGSNNAGDAFDLRVTRRAADSTYAGIVRLVEAAQASKAPMARLADRYSLLFLVATIALATAACGGSPATRSAPSRFWLWRHPVRSSWPFRWLWSPGCHARRISAF